MQLLRLELKGFKSFADKTTVNFSSGMTAIVGPNGSGKSNITDAIRWVLGESNVRNLRGQKAEDIIFSGTEKRRPLGAAEATLIFDNSDKQLPDNLEEVAISRRIYRTGESEFFINKRSCRLKDIHLLLADTGLGKDSMAIIGQNRVDAILNSKPEERRLIFEDVAGISRFKINKEDALRRIQGTERNMERVRDLLATLGEQLVDLSAKAEKTKKYLALGAEKRQYDGAMAFHEFKTSERLLTRLENEHIALNGEDTELQTELTELETKRQKLQIAISQRQSDLQTWENNFSEAKQLIEQLKGRKALLAEQERTATQTVADLENRIEEATASYEAGKQQVQLLQQLIQSDDVAETEQTSDVDVAKAAYEEVLEQVQLTQENLQSLQQASSERQSAQLELVTKSERLKADITLLTKTLEELQGQYEELAGEVAEAGQEVNRLTETAESKKRELATQEEKRQQVKAEIQNFRKELQENSQAQQKLMRDYQRAEGRLQLLAQWEENHEGYVEAVKTVLKAKAPWRSGIKGAVGDLFKTEDKFLTAIEIALGAGINNIITSTSKVAAEAVQYLKAQQGGRATFLPMEAVKGRRLDSPAVNEKGVLGLAVDCLTFESDYTDIFTYLLGRTLIVETLDQAIALQRQYKQQLRLVTLEGEQLNPGGSLTGGSQKRRKASVLARREEQSQLEALINNAGAEQKVLQDQQAELEIKIKTLTDNLVSLEEDYKVVNIEVLTADTKLRTASERKNRKEKVYAEIVTKVEDSKYAQDQARTELAQAEKDLTTFLDSSTGENSQNQLLQNLQKLQLLQQERYEVYTNERVALEQLQKSKEEKKEQKAKLEKDLSTYNTRMAPLEASLLEAREKVTSSLPQELTKLTQQLEEAQQLAEDLRVKRELAYSEGKEEQTLSQDLSTQIQDLSKRQQLVQRRLMDMEGRLAKNRLDTEIAEQKLTDLGYTKLEAQNMGLAGTIGNWKDKIAALAAAIAELGTVNPNAVEEYEEAVNKHDFLAKQQQDLETAKKHLQDVISEMDAAMASQLEEVLGVVAVRFQAIFEQLFGGGSAQIILTKPDDILQSGIELLIQPPGKKRQQLTLLSGGERALTVIALLFAFLDYRPAPFCVLDEVDAALDEANVDRYSRYLHELGSNTQFIVVSHRKRTMESAEVLQGVTMVERGVSRLLTVAFEDVKEDM